MRALPFCLALGISFPGSAPLAAGGCTRDAMLVFNGSASMGELDHVPTAPTRIIEALRAVQVAMPDIAPYRRVGLLTYGPGGGDAC